MRTLPLIRTFKNRVSQAVRIWQIDGFQTLVKVVIARLAYPGAKISIPTLGKNKVTEFYGFVKPKEFGPVQTTAAPAEKLINWFIPPFGFGSGGHTTIFRTIKFLEGQGFRCNVVIVGEPLPTSAAAAKKQINEWFFPIQAEVYLDLSQVPPSKIAMATSWQTAYFVNSFSGATHKCYFVQDFEPWFYAMGSEYVWAEETYRLGFKAITAGDWLRNIMSEQYGMEAISFGFSYEKELYKPVPKTTNSCRNVFFYARPPTQRRGFELGMLILQEVTNRIPDVGVVFAGWDISGYDVPFRHKNAGTVSREELPSLFCECDVALVLSLTNLSLLPLELMACGVPVVSNKSPCVEWMLNDDNSCLAQPTVGAMADAICSLLNSKDNRDKLAHNGLDFASGTDWDAELSKVSNYLDKL